MHFYSGVDGNRTIDLEKRHIVEWINANKLDIRILRTVTTHNLDGFSVLDDMYDSPASGRT